jgi:hypothetical protein
LRKWSNLSAFLNALRKARCWLGNIPERTASS